MRISLVLMAVAVSAHLGCQPGGDPSAHRMLLLRDTLVVAFYNVENLFDVDDDRRNHGDDEYTPDGSRRWTQERYDRKLNDLARAIRSIDELRGPDVIGLAEVENRRVLERLVGEFLPSGAYGIVHHDSPDERGIDVALLYRRNRVEFERSAAHRVDLDDGDRTRDILEATLSSRGTRFTVLVNHWPSRSGGRVESEPKRLRAAAAAARIIDSLAAASSATELIMIGDFNDEPFDHSIARTIGDRMINLAEPLARTGGIGSYYYKGRWEVIDQILVSPALLDSSGLVAIETSQHVFAPEFLRDARAHATDRPPYRTYKGNHYIRGVSDHFPVFARIGVR